MSSVLAVESPAKAKAIQGFLDEGIVVLPTHGHVRDLARQQCAVDPENNYAMRYEAIERNEWHVKKIAKALKTADTLYLATDPDREGEAVSWHLYELLKEQCALEGKKVYRIVFYEITKAAILEAIESTRQLDFRLIDAWNARCAIAFLYDAGGTSLLFRKYHKLNHSTRLGLSEDAVLRMGLSEDAVLRMIAERESEIEAFIPLEYWTLEGDIKSGNALVNGRLVEYKKEKVEQFTFTNEEQAHAARDAVIAAADGKIRISKIDKKQRKRNPTAPFTTSTMQQEAARKLGFNTQRTMRTAQSLYEGIETDEGTTGLITYMRTDSVSLAAEAIDEIRGLIDKRYGPENVPAEAPVYKTKAKNAQEAHEGIRPTSALRTPEDLKERLEPDQYKLYSLIWKRTVASQMVPAVFDTVAIDMQPENTPETARLRANGSTLVEAGFIAVYQEGSDDVKDDKADRTLPPLEENELLDLAEFKADQHFTDPQPRFTEASLVKTLEESGIGRPSTYASIISTLKFREAIEMDGNRFIPTDIGRMVAVFLSNYFTQYVDYDFIAHFEDVLDEISRGECEWVPLLEQFWVPFHKLVEDKEVSVSREEAAQARQLGTDPKSGKPVSVRLGRYGAFVQIGTKDDEDKPKFAGLKPGQKINSINFEEAMELFKLPRKLGETPEGEKVSASIGRFGPYVRYNDKFVSIRGEDPYTITLEAALEFVKQKKIDDANRLILDFPDDGIQVLNGRYGPYITNLEKNARIPKDREPSTLTLEECKDFLEKAPLRKPFSKKKFGKKKAASNSDDEKGG